MLFRSEEIVARMGFSSLTTYAWVHHFSPSQFGFPRSSYAEAARANAAQWEKYRRQFAIPYYPNVSMGWDPSPRTVPTDKFADRGYPYSAVLEGNTPAAFREALQKARAFVEAGNYAHKLVTLNAWNEWTEGSYLLPDTVNGTAYLEAVRAVFGA